ncbi:MAG: methionine ABC transporter ATP-binding protein [Eubacteriales bacterium]|nr:methionine ABC transporter ATP-binding protein [Eubacteriales bacterium]
MINIKHLGKYFVTDSGNIEVLNDVSLDIGKGEIFGIIGLSGAGKSTLARCINFLEKPTSGQVIFDGMDLGSLSHGELLRARQSIGMIFQNFNLFEQRTALRNITYPLEITGVPGDRAKERARSLLRLVGLTDKERAYPSQLSGGQKQRVAIARALATEPKVLLCDEITSALDPNTTRSILELLKDINRSMGVTIVIITHEMSVIEQICTRVAVIDNSKIVEVGSVREVFLTPRSKIAKELILPKSETVERFAGSKCLRVVFDGNSAFEPIISNMTLECHAAVNILGADTKNIDGRAYGQMLLQLPDNEMSAARIRAYLDSRQIHYKEETFNGNGND